MTPKRLTELT
uniref:Uncharacterized protein n=1 Tax=Anguilla anguilla TaxID=7936 RepID=A0A0E9RTA4_ANGAN